VVIEGIAAECVYNVNESGCSQWADKPAEIIVLVPTDHAKDRVFLLIDRHSGPPMMVGCIVGGGSAMKSMIIVDRAAMEDDLLLFGYDPRKVLMVSHSKAFIITALFEMG
jgi:hypothetical protein